MQANNKNDSNATPLTVLVLGATGGVGRHVVRHLQNSGHRVKAIVRSQTKLETLLASLDATNPLIPALDSPSANVTIVEASLLDLSDKELQAHVQDVDAAVSCLGHTLDWNGIFGHPRRLVKDATARVTNALSLQTGKPNKPKFVLLGSDGVAHPNGSEATVRSWSERTLISLIRWLLPPHVDNEDAAAYLYENWKMPTTSTTDKPSTEGTSVEWVTVRPTDLIDDDIVVAEPNEEENAATPANTNTPKLSDDTYKLETQPTASLFGGTPVLRRNVALAISNLLTEDALWQEWKYQFPVVYTQEASSSKSTS